MKNRIIWIDYAKAFLIFCVCLVHTHCDETLTTLLKAFIIPTFFFISGFLFQKKPDVTSGAFAIKRFRQLIVPYIWINFIAYLCWLLALRHFGPDAANPTPWHEPLTAVILGLPSGLIHDIPTWFLVCLFVVEITYSYVSRIVTSDVVIAVVFLLIAYAASFLKFELPYAIGPAMAGTAFYAIGHLCRRHIPLLSSNGIPARWTALTALADGSLFAFAALSNSRIGFFVNDYGSSFTLFLCAAVAGITAVIGISGTAAGILHERKLILLISDSTLIICGFHLLMFAAIKGVFLFVFHVADYNRLQSGSILAGVLISLAAMALCVPLAMLIHRKARFLVDK